jgi:hypothetical protein
MWWLIKVGFSLAFFLLWVVSAWRLHTKAGQAGWVGLVPVLNTLGELKMAGRPYWWILLSLVPVLGQLMRIIRKVGVARSFGKTALFGLGLCFVPMFFEPAIGLGTARYRGPARD